MDVAVVNQDAPPTGVCAVVEFGDPAAWPESRPNLTLDDQRTQSEGGLMAQKVTFVDPLTGVPLRQSKARVFHPGVEDRPAKVDLDVPPADDATVSKVLTWVGSDPERAMLALVREQAGANRVTLVRALAELLGATTGDDPLYENADVADEGGYADDYQGNPQDVEPGDHDAQEA